MDGRYLKTDAASGAYPSSDAGRGRRARDRDVHVGIPYRLWPLALKRSLLSLSPLTMYVSVCQQFISHFSRH